jgi:hypothetical protein
MVMPARDDKVKRLLDGDIDEAEIASDPMLSSLAERIFGLSIEPITPVKPSAATGLPQLGESGDAKPSLMSMVEVVPGSTPLPLPTLSLIPDSKSNSKSGGRKLKFFSLTSLVISIANIFGVFGMLFGSMCATDKCVDGMTRINWASVWELDNHLGWSHAFPTMGVPDYVAVVASALVFIIASRR